MQNIFYTRKYLIGTPSSIDLYSEFKTLKYGEVTKSLKFTVDLTRLELTIVIKNFQVS